MKNEKRIKYFSYYGCADPLRHRDNSSAAGTKMRIYNRCVEPKWVLYGSYFSGFLLVWRHYVPSYVKQMGCNTLRYFASFGKNTGSVKIARATHGYEK